MTRNANKFIIFIVALLLLMLELTACSNTESQKSMIADSAKKILLKQMIIKQLKIILRL